MINKETSKELNKLSEIIEVLNHNKKLLRENNKRVAYLTGYPVDLIKKARKIRKKLLLKTTPKVISIPNILSLDIETVPLKAYVWSRWKLNIYLEQTISEWFMLSWAAKWLGEDEVYSDVLNPTEVILENDKRIVTSLWDLLNKADIVIAHNGKSFDIPKINSRFIINNLLPPTPYKQIDTKEVAARSFGFSSNKLDALATYFGYLNKDETDFNLWVRCMEGDLEALYYMELYNKNDVIILEKVYLKLRPWIKNHPNVGLYMDSNSSVCPYCGSVHIEHTEGSYLFNQTTKYPIVRCSECGGISRLRTNLINKEKRNNLIISI